MIIIGESLRPFIEGRLESPLADDCRFMGSEINGDIKAVIAAHDYKGKGSDIHLSIASVKGALFRDLIRFVASYVYELCGCSRVTTVVKISNKKSQRLTEHIGFRREGLLRNYYEDEDYILYGMLKKECIYYGKT